MVCWRRKGLCYAVRITIFERKTAFWLGVLDVSPFNMRHFVNIGGADDFFAWHQTIHLPRKANSVPLSMLLFHRNRVSLHLRTKLLYRPWLLLVKNTHLYATLWIFCRGNFKTGFEPKICFRYLMRYFIGAEQISCSPTSPDQLAREGGSTLCKVTFVLIYYFGMASSIW